MPASPNLLSLPSFPIWLPLRFGRVGSDAFAGVSPPKSLRKSKPRSKLTTPKRIAKNSDSGGSNLSVRRKLVASGLASPKRKGGKSISCDHLADSAATAAAAVKKTQLGYVLNDFPGGECPGGSKSARSYSSKSRCAKSRRSPASKTKSPPGCKSSSKSPLNRPKNPTTRPQKPLAPPLLSSLSSSCAGRGRTTNNSLSTAAVHPPISKKKGTRGVGGKRDIAKSTLAGVCASYYPSDGNIKPHAAGDRYYKGKPYGPQCPRI